MHCIPAVATHWSLRLMSRHASVSPYLVGKVWRAAWLKPPPHQHVQFQQESRFRRQDHHAPLPRVVVIVRSVDEKTQIQALGYTQPLLQLALHQVERRTHDHVRHGTTSLYAAFEATGRVIGRTNHRHRVKEYVSFLNLLITRGKASRTRKWCTPSLPTAPRTRLQKRGNGRQRIRTSTSISRPRAPRASML